MKLMIPLLFIPCLASSGLSAQHQSEHYEIGELLFAESFDGDLSNWGFEAESPSESAIQIKDSQLHFSTFGGGATAWFLHKLKGSVLIEYTATPMPIAGVADSVADLNSFWMLTDLKHPEDIQADSSARAGSFGNYHKLPGYYVSKGAGRNSRTTFKKHDMRGSGARIDWGVLTDENSLLKPSFPHNIQLIFYDGPDSALVRYICDDALYFEKWDPQPNKSGWFAFRGWNTNVRYDDFKVYRLLPKAPRLTK